MGEFLVLSRGDDGGGCTFEGAGDGGAAVVDAGAVEVLERVRGGGPGWWHLVVMLVVEMMLCVCCGISKDDGRWIGGGGGGGVVCV